MIAALTNLPEALLPPRLSGAAVASGELESVLDEQRRQENLAYCRTVVAVYALFRNRYGDREAAFLASGPVTGADLFAERRELSLAYSAVKAEVSVSLLLGPVATETVIDQSIGFIERLPRVFALIGANEISARSAQEALSRSRALTAEQVAEFDERLVRILRADPLQLVSLPALREAADRIVCAIDPAAAERRRRLAEDDRTLTIRPAEDGMAAAYALLTAHEGRELAVRVDEVAASVCGDDPRTAPQRRSDALMMLVRGYSTLGCRCERPGCSLQNARRHDECADADCPGAHVVTRYRTLIHVIVNDRTLADTGDSNPGYLIGHGPITAEHARGLAQRDDAVIRPFGTELDDSPARDSAPAPEPAPGAASGGAAGGHARPPSYRSSGIDILRRPRTKLLLADGCHLRRSAPRPPQARAAAPPTGESPTDGSPTAAPPTVKSRTDRPQQDRPSTGRSLPDAVAPPDLPPALVTARAGRGYRFSADLTRYFALLYPRCVFPLCTRPASRCQLDHAREYDHRDPARGGASSADNGQPLCVEHHQLKTAGVWTDARLPDGRILWIGPSGRRIVVDPAGTILTLFPGLGRIAWTASAPSAPTRSPRTPNTQAPNTQTPNTQTPNTPNTQARSPGDPTRLQREHDRRQRLRAAHVEALRAERAAPHSAVERALETVLGGAPAPLRPPPDGEPPPF